MGVQMRCPRIGREGQGQLLIDGGRKIWAPRGGRGGGGGSRGELRRARAFSLARETRRQFRSK